MKQIHYIFIFLITILAFSCKKKECDNPNVVDGIDVTQLPPATMVGANTMGCLINGEVWLPLGTNILGDLVYDITFSVTGPSEGGGVTIQGRRIHEDFNERMSIASENVIEVGIYNIAPWIIEYVDSNSDCGFFDLDSTFNNYLEVTRLDFEEDIVSGLFQMRVYANDCDTLTITEGRFDLSP